MPRKVGFTGEEKARTEILLIPRVMRQSPSVVNRVTMRSITKRKKSEMPSNVQKIADRYEHIVYWSDEDRCYIGQCPELFFGGVHGADTPYRRYADTFSCLYLVGASWRASRYEVMALALPSGSAMAT
jgi:hypothetical protein